MSEPNKNKRAASKTVKKKSTSKKTAVKKIAINKTSVKKNQVNKPKNKKRSAKATKVINTAKNKTVEKNEVIIFDAVIIINEVRILHKKLLNIAIRNRSIILDASKVEMIDTASIQLLLSFITSIQKNSMDFKWRNPSDEFLERVSILNLTDALGINGLNHND